ncbi:MAG: Asp-tRNA(Asn)/Glu-tRNA(Gln) amidotransferase subunit GatC [Gammaproteobacteria bacterium]
MALTREQIEKIATLSRVELSTETAGEVTANVSRIVDFFEVLSSVDTDGVSPMAHPLDMTQRLRADTVTEIDERDKFQQSAAQIEAGLYLVPKVIE